jgi:hypothetical protein
MRTILLSLALIALAVVLAGCGGSSRTTINTGTNGSMLGLVITPEPQSLGIDRGDDFFLDWPAGYEPPSSFTVSLRQVDTDATTEAIFTEVDTYSTGHYRVRPTSTLPAGTFLLLRIVSDRETVRAMFLTDDSGFAMTRKANIGAGQAEHTITTTGE